MFKPVPIKLKRGEAVFHHPLAVHGSYENKLVQSPKKTTFGFNFKTSKMVLMIKDFVRSERWRRAAVINFMADGTRLLFTFQTF